MIASVYCRKSTEQTGVADDQKSVARQIEHAKAYAQRKGWTVADEHVYVDDNASGAEFTTRPGYMRVLNALKPRAPFTVLIVSELSRLGREPPGWRVRHAYGASRHAVRCAHSTRSASQRSRRQTGQRRAGVGVGLQSTGLCGAGLPGSLRCP